MAPGGTGRRRATPDGAKRRHPASCDAMRCHRGWPAPPRGLPLGRAHPRRHDRARPAQPGACVRSARGAAAPARPGRARTRRGRRRRAGPPVRSRPRRRSAWRLVLVGLQGPRPRRPPAHLARRGRCRPLPASSAPTCGGAGSTPAASRARCSSLAAHLASFSSGCAVMSWSVRVVLCSSARTVPSGPDNSEPNGGLPAARAWAASAMARRRRVWSSGVVMTAPFRCGVGAGARPPCRVLAKPPVGGRSRGGRRRTGRGRRPRR